MKYGIIAFAHFILASSHTKNTHTKTCKNTKNTKSEKTNKHTIWLIYSKIKMLMCLKTRSHIK